MEMKKAVKATVLYDGKPDGVLKDVYVVWENDKFLGVFKEKPEDVEFLDYEGVVTPAFIDAHCHIGETRAGEPSGEEETNEKYESVLPLVDAYYSIYMDDKSFRESVEWGVLYSCILPGSGNIIGGRGIVIRNYGRDIDEAFIKHAGLKAALGYNPRRTVDWKGSRPYTRMGAISLFRKWLMKARDALKLIESGKKTEEEFEPEIRALFPVLKGEEVLRVHVHKIDDIMCLFTLRREYGFKFTIEHAMDVHTRECFEKIKSENVPITYGPIDAFAYKTELKHENWRNVKMLVEVKPFFGLMTDHPVVLQRNLFLQLRFFRRFGLSRAESISITTLNNSKILGIDNILGTIERGKWASFILWNDDPFSLESYPILVVGEGKILYKE